MNMIKLLLKINIHLIKEKGINHRLVMEIGVGGKGYKDSIYTRRYDVFVGDYGSYELIKPDKKEFKQNETITFVS